MRPLSRLLVIALLALAAGSCFESPVAESLLLEFLPEGLVTITARTRISDLDEKNPALQRRLEEARRAALEGTDPWSRRFEALGPAIERGRWEKHDGRLVLWEHSATTDDPGALGRFFADSGVAIDWRRDEDGRNELFLYPPANGSATRQQRQQVTRGLAEWSQRVAAYLARTADLWDHLEEHPERDRACLARLFESYLPEGAVEATGPLTDAEGSLMNRVKDAMDEAIAVLQVPEGEAYSLDELSRQVYDPFPAPLEITLPSPALESEGFRAGTGSQATRLLAGGTSLWQALRGLENRWLSPDPMLALVEHDLSPHTDRPFDLDGFLARTRRASAAPTATEVKEALTTNLEAPSAYRVLWLDPAAPEHDLEVR